MVKGRKNKIDKDIKKTVPLAFVLGYIPLIVRLHVYDSHFEAFTWFPAWEDGTMYDFFLYFKAAAVIITAVVMLFIMLYDKVSDVRNRKKRSGAEAIRHTARISLTYVALSGYLFFVLISGVSSEHRSESFLGSAESFESVPVILSYGVFFIYAYMYILDAEDLRRLLKLSFPGFALIGIISLLQFLKADPFKTGLLRLITVPGRYSELRDSLSFTFRPGEVYATLYNSNYVPQYFGFGMFPGVYFLIFEKGLKSKIKGLVTVILSAFAVIGSGSRTGLIAFAVAFMFFLFLIPRYSDTKAASACRIVSAVSVAAVVIMSVFLVITGRTFSILKGAGFIAEEKEEPFIKDVITDADGVCIKAQGGDLHLNYETDGEECSIDLRDENGLEPAYDFTDDMSGYVIRDGSFAGMKLTPVYVDEKICLCVETDGRELVFLNAGEDTGYLYYNKAGKFAPFKHYDRSTLFPDTMFSDRGLLWNNCIKLLPEYIFKGSGAGTFVYVYPNDDDYYRLYDDTGYEFYDVKAHSLYFQQFIENGGLAFLFFLIFFISISANVISRLGEPLVFAVLTGCFCYMICSVTVDSNVNTAPLFWVLSGCISRYIKKGITKTHN